MNQPPRFAQLAMRALAREALPSSHPAADEEVANIAEIAAIMRATKAARRRRQIAFGTLAVAAGVSLTVGVGSLALRTRTVASVPANATSEPISNATGHTLAGSVLLLRDGREVALEQGTTIAKRDRILAADGRAALQLSTGTHLAIERGADLTVGDLGSTQAFALHAGAVRADVAKLKSGERFLIRTGDSEIEVRGTSFRVGVVPPSPNCGGGSTTRVQVTEGVVVVRAAGGEDRVAAGEEWPRGCAPTPAASPPLVSPTPSPGLQKPAPTIASVARPASPSELAAQNELFRQATSAKRDGRNGTAIRSYEEFIAKYPRSALAENAAVERMRLLRATDRASAEEAARRYLVTYPNGFARDEAARLLEREP